MKYYNYINKKFNLKKYFLAQFECSEVPLNRKKVNCLIKILFLKLFDLINILLKVFVNFNNTITTGYITTLKLFFIC